ILKMVQLAARFRREKLRNEENAARLTKREMQVLTALAGGKSNKEIAEDLRISVDTERTHMFNILGKLGAHSRLQALVVAVQMGLIDIERVSP
ncbi:MAG: response regulator transcription factor, partial [Rubrobacter sp.]